MKKSLKSHLFIALLFFVILTFSCNNPNPKEQVPKELRTYVLVHGAYGSTAGYVPIKEKLEKLGHKAYMVALTGHGERKHLSDSSISLETHIMDVVNLILHYDLKNIHLVGHSYGGMVITGTWDRVRDRIAKIYYLDAHVPSNGNSLLSTSPPERNEEWKRIAKENGGFIPIPVKDPELTPQSFKTFSQPLFFKNGPLPTNIPKVYISATNSGLKHLRKQGLDRKDDPSWIYYEVESGHIVMRDKPDQFIEILLQ